MHNLAVSLSGRDGGGTEKRPQDDGGRRCSGGTAEQADARKNADIHAILTEAVLNDGGGVEKRSQEEAGGRRDRDVHAAVVLAEEPLKDYGGGVDIDLLLPPA